MNPYSHHACYFSSIMLQLSLQNSSENNTVKKNMEMTNIQCKRSFDINVNSMATLLRKAQFLSWLRLVVIKRVVKERENRFEQNGICYAICKFSPFYASIISFPKYVLPWSRQDHVEAFT